MWLSREEGNSPFAVLEIDDPWVSSRWAVIVQQKWALDRADGAAQQQGHSQAMSNQILFVSFQRPFRAGTAQMNDKILRGKSGLNFLSLGSQ